MKLKYNHDIFTEEIPLTTDKPTGKSFTTQHGNETCYAPLAETATDAFDLHTVDDGDVYSVPIIPCYRLYYANGTVETAPAGTALDLNNYSDIIKVLSNSNGTITANSAGTAIGGKNVSLIGGEGNDVFIHGKGNNTIANYAAGDVISLISYNATDIIAVKVDNVNGGATLGFDEDNWLIIEGVTNETPITIKSAADTLGTRYFFATHSIKSGNSSANLYVSNIEKCLTYGSYRRTDVTLNGAAEAVNGKKKFIADSLLAGEYASSVTSIKPSDSMADSLHVYIQGNSGWRNYIYSNKNGHSLDGGLGDDLLFSGDGADTFVYRKGNGDNIAYRFKRGKDKVMLLNANGEPLRVDDFTVSFNGNDIIFRINGDTADNLLTIKDSFTYNNATSIMTTVNGTVYTFLRRSAIIADGKVTLDGATAYNVTLTDKTNGVTIINYNAGVNLTNLAFDEIKNCSYSSGTITLGLESSSVVLQGVETNALKLNGATVYVDTNMIFNAADSLSATGFSLTSDNTAGIDIAGTSTAVKVDASRTQGGITLISGTGNDTLIGSAINDSLTGNAGADLFVYNGGHDVIVDYSATDGDKISVTADDMLNFSVYPFGGLSDTDITVNGTEEGNSLIIKGGVGQIITLLGAKGASKELNYSHIIDNDDGRLNTAETSIILKNRTTNFVPTADVYPKLATIDASYVTTPNIAIRAVNSIASCIIAGNNGMSLYGGSKNDTLKSGKGNSTLTGGTGIDIFMHEGGADVITNYKINDRDKVNLANGKNMGDISGVKVDTTGATLTFGDNDSIALQGIASTDAVTFTSANDTYGTGYVLEDDKLRTATRRGVTLTTENVTHTIASGEVTVVANKNGTIIGNGTQAVTLSGTNISIIGGALGGTDASISGGTGNETFLYNGGGMTISSYSENGRISLANGYTLQDKELVTVDGTENLVLTIADSNKTTTAITVENTADLKSVKVNVNGTDNYIYLPHVGNEMVFSHADSLASNEVTITAAHSGIADFGVFSADETEPSTTTGAEYYSSLITITADKKDVTVVGNAKANTFNIAGGANNVLTGGIGKDTFIFKSGGGVITDFGVGATKNNQNDYLASTTKRTATSTYVGFDRTNTGSYTCGTDILKLNGTVDAIYYDIISDYGSASINTFDVAIVYTDTNGKDEVILLPDITKNYGGKKGTSYLHDEAASKITIYDNAHTTALTAGDKETLVHDWTDFPVSLQAQTIKLYNMYNSSNFKNGYASLSPVPQVLPDWVPDKEWLS